MGALFFPRSTLFSKDFHFRLLFFSCFPQLVLYFHHLCSLSFQDHWRCLQPTLQDHDPGSEQHNIKVKKKKKKE